MSTRYCSECAKNSLRPRQWPCAVHPDANFLDQKMLEEKVSALRTISIAASLRGAIIHTISSPAGLSVSFGDLMVFRLEDGTYAVDSEDEDWQHVYKTAHEAADAFEEVRRRMKLGYDFEVEPESSAGKSSAVFHEVGNEIIHFVSMGRTACDFSSKHGVPGKWSPGHLWSRDWKRVNCAGCYIVHDREQAAKANEISNPRRRP